MNIGCSSQFKAVSLERVLIRISAGVGGKRCCCCRYT